MHFSDISPYDFAEFLTLKFILLIILSNTAADSSYHLWCAVSEDLEPLDERQGTFWTGHQSIIWLFK